MISVRVKTSIDKLLIERSQSYGREVIFISGEGTVESHNINLYKKKYHKDPWQDASKYEGYEFKIDNQKANFTLEDENLYEDSNTHKMKKEKLYIDYFTSKFLNRNKNKGEFRGSFFVDEKKNGKIDHLSAILKCPMKFHEDTASKFEKLKIEGKRNSLLMCFMLEPQPTKFREDNEEDEYCTVWEIFDFSYQFIQKLEKGGD